MGFYGIIWVLEIYFMFKYSEGQKFALRINGEEGVFQITKCDPVEIAYTLNNWDRKAEVQSITIDRTIFENKTKHKTKGLVSIDIAGNNNFASVEYLDENEQGLTK